MPRKVFPESRYMGREKSWANRNSRSDSASPLWAPQDYLALENRFTHGEKVYTIVGHDVEAYPEKFCRPDISERL